MERKRDRIILLTIEYIYEKKVQNLNEIKQLLTEFAAHYTIQLKMKKSIPLVQAFKKFIENEPNYIITIPQLYNSLINR